jgi:hypothetical protein
MPYSNYSNNKAITKIVMAFRRIKLYAKLFSY